MILCGIQLTNLHISCEGDKKPANAAKTGFIVIIQAINFLPNVWFPLVAQWLHCIQFFWCNPGTVLILSFREAYRVIFRWTNPNQLQPTHAVTLHKFYFHIAGFLHQTINNKPSHLVPSDWVINARGTYLSVNGKLQRTATEKSLHLKDGNLVW